jgi:hypothetical protein
MRVNDFFQKYANTPLALRNTPLSFKDGGDTTLNDCYQRIKELENEMLPMRLEQDKLMKLASVLLDRIK